MEQIEASITKAFTTGELVFFFVYCLLVGASAYSFMGGKSVLNAILGFVSTAFLMYMMYTRGLKRGLRLARFARGEG